MTQDSLKTYRQKRDFSKTTEPKGNSGDGDKKKGQETMGKKTFVIQKHDAQNLHYDFRLEMDGVLKSWAVPKGLSTAANEKRLAVRTEDHPLEYGDFEGVIPEGEYGAGTVMVWDKGTYEPIIEDKEDKKSPKKALEDGALKFTLEGKKLKGGYALAKTGMRGGDEQWVIFKLDDDEADARRNPTSSEPDSVLTGRSLDEIAKEESEEKEEKEEKNA